MVAISVFFLWGLRQSRRSSRTSTIRAVGLPTQTTQVTLIRQIRRHDDAIVASSFDGKNVSVGSAGTSRYCQPSACRRFQTWYPARRWCRAGQCRRKSAHRRQAQGRRPRPVRSIAQQGLRGVICHGAERKWGVSKGSIQDARFAKARHLHVSVVAVLAASAARVTRV
jgi:hypothetical protein